MRDQVPIHSQIREQLFAYLLIFAENCRVRFELDIIDGSEYTAFGERGAYLMHPTARDPTTSKSSEDGQRFIEIVEQARAGDKTAFDTLFQHYNARICAYLAHMVGDEEEGRDLAQETFLKAWQCLANLPQREIATALKLIEKSVSIYVSRGSEQFRLAYQRLSWTNESVSKEGDKAHDRIDPHALYRLGTETSG